MEAFNVALGTLAGSIVMGFGVSVGVVGGFKFATWVWGAININVNNKTTVMHLNAEP